MTIYMHYRIDVSILHSTHGGDQTSKIWISILAGFPGHSYEWQGLLFTSVKDCVEFLGLPWKVVWKLRGLPWELVEILEVVIILSLISPSVVSVTQLISIRVICVAQRICITVLTCQYERYALPNLYALPYSNVNSSYMRCPTYVHYRIDLSIWVICVTQLI